MAITLIFIMCVVSLFLWKRRGNFSGKFIFLFATMWLVDVVLMSFDVYHVNGIRSTTMSLIIFSILLYILGYSLMKGYGENKVKRAALLSSFDKRIESFSRNKALQLIYTIAIIIILTQFFKVLPLLLAEGHMGGGLRVEALTGQLYSPLFYTFNNYIFSPLYRISLPLAGYFLITKKNLFTTFLTFIYCLLYPSLFGGRLSFFIFGFSVALCYLWCKSFNVIIIRKDIKSIITALSIAIVLLFTGMTIAKSGDVSDVKGSFEELKEDMVLQPLRYFVCPLKAFDYAIEHHYPSKLGGYMNGRATFASIDYYVNPVLNRMSGTHDPNANSIIGHLIQEEWISLSSDVPSWNALYTALLHFYVDFGVVGCLFFSFLFGILTRWAINKMTLKVSLPYFFLAFFFMTMSFMSCFSYYPVGGDVMPFLLYIFIWIKLEKSSYVLLQRKRFVY